MSGDGAKCWGERGTVSYRTSGSAAPSAVASDAGLFTMDSIWSKMEPDSAVMRKFWNSKKKKNLLMTLISSAECEMPP